MSNKAPSFEADLYTMLSRQLTSCLIRFATISSYSFMAVDENARFQDLR